MIAPATFPVVLCIYSARPILVQRRPLLLPALTIAQQLSSIRGEAKSLSTHCTLYTFDCHGGLWFVVVNRHPTKYLSITVDCSGSTGLASSRAEIRSPAALPLHASSPVSARGLRTHDFVPPRHRQLLLALIADRPTGGYSYKRTCSFMYVDGVSGARHTPLLRRGHDAHQPVPMDLSFVARIV